MKTPVLLFVALSLSLLAGCSHFNLGKQPVNPVFAACKMNCDQRAAACQKVCRNNCPQCCSYANQSAANAYYDYRHEQIVKGGFIVRQLKSYRDPLQCRKTTCNCKADYQICIQTCGGRIPKQLKAAPQC